MGIKIEKLNTELPVYDLTVEGNHNFYANDILVHNCIEIVQYTDEETTAICTLSSMILKNFIINGKFDYQLLYNEVRKVVKALNVVIDKNYYSTEKGKKGGLEQRAIGIGAQGLADVFMILDLVFTSDEARDVNKKIFETIYFAALSESNSLCKTGKQKPYAFFEGSPISKGQFQFNLWGLKDEELSGLWDFDSLRKDIIEYGVCNSLVTAAMPTASSARLTNSYEMFEVITNNIFSRRVKGGEFLIINKYLVEDLDKIGLWSEEIKNEIIINEGYLSKVNFNKFLDSEDKHYKKKLERVQFLIEKHKTIWETKQKDLISMAADRGPFIDQSQSMNIYMENPTVAKLTSSHFYAWRSGLKTLCYYVRTKAISTGAKHLGIDMSAAKQPEVHKVEEVIPQKPENSPFECFGCSA